MTKGILLGILLQCISATGYLVIVNVASIKSELFRTSLMILFASIVAIIFLVYSVKSGQQNLTDIQPKDYLIIGVGSIMVMFVAQLIFFFGVDEANMTTMAFTMLAFPIISLILELIVGRVKLTSLGIYDLIGFVLMVAGYVVFVSKPVTQ